MTTRSRASAFLRAWTPVLIWMGVIFAFSAQESLPGLDNSTADLLLKKGGHSLGFGGLALLSTRAVRGGKALSAGHLAWALLITCVYAVSDELHQSLVPGRTPSAVDWGIDLAGACAAIVWRWSRRRREL